LIVVICVKQKQLPQMPLAKDDNMVKAVPSDRADEPLTIAILPGRSRCSRWQAPFTTPVRSSAIVAFGREPGGGLIVMPDSFNIVHRNQIMALAAQHRLPIISPYRFMAQGGGLMAYGVEPVELFRRAAAYVDRILKGTKPAELPVQAPTKFEFERPTFAFGASRTLQASNIRAVAARERFVY
jgi:ABC transporter substrate binding protein